MKKMAEKRSRWISLGHGEYSEIPYKKDFFSVVKVSERKLSVSSSVTLDLPRSRWFPLPRLQSLPGNFPASGPLALAVLHREWVVESRCELPEPGGARPVERDEAKGCCSGCCGSRCEPSEIVVE
ncbi:putative thioredoxin domain-containing protein 9-like protein [Sesbania bispinosa]|nr:putative thioredoxin domain-containing protein 9-like protein [Sesbania bispinosa]